MSDHDATGFRNEREMTIEWGQCDPAGIVFNPRYFEFFDWSTALLLEAATGMRKAAMTAHHGIVGTPVVETRAVFHAPTRFGDRVRIVSTVWAVKRSSFRVSHRLFRGDTLCVEGEETRVWAGRHPDDPERLASVAIPAAISAALAGG